MKLLRELGGALLLAAVVFGPSMLAGQARPPQPPSGVSQSGRGAEIDGRLLGVETAPESGQAGDLRLVRGQEGRAELVLQRYPPGRAEDVRAGLAGTHPDGDVPDDGEPVMTIASMTLEGAPGDSTTIPVSQIAIELYRPLPGGLAPGGRFAPSAMKVPGLVERAGGRGR